VPLVGSRRAIAFITKPHFFDHQAAPAETCRNINPLRQRCRETIEIPWRNLELYILDHPGSEKIRLFRLWIFSHSLSANQKTAKEQK